jgi:hypothetical protein
MNIVSNWVDRSGPLPLSFIICAQQTHYYPRDIRNYRILQSLFSRYSRRLQFLYLDSDEEGFANIKCHGPFPLLKKIALAYAAVFIPDGVIEMFGNAPQLREVHLENFAVQSFFFLPWRHLTKFTGEIWNTDIFSLAPNLLEATVSVTPDNQHKSKSVIVHPTLRSLTFFAGTRGHFSPSIKALDFLTLPGLEHLHMCKTHDHTATHTTLSSFLSRSSPSLTSLSISAEDIPPSWENTIPFRTLECLRLSDPLAIAFEKTLLTWLEADAEEHLPYLQELVFVERMDDGYKTLLASLSHISTTKVRPFRLFCEQGYFSYSPSHVVNNLKQLGPPSS